MPNPGIVKGQYNITPMIGGPVIPLSISTAGAHLAKTQVMQSEGTMSHLQWEASVSPPAIRKLEPNYLDLNRRQHHTCTDCVYLRPLFRVPGTPDESSSAIGGWHQTFLDKNIYSQSKHLPLPPKLGYPSDFGGAKIVFGGS